MKKTKTVIIIMALFIFILFNTACDRITNSNVLADNIPNTCRVITEDTVLTWEDAGYIPVDTTSGAVQLTMPALSVDHVGAEFIFALATQAGGNYLTIISNAADHNFYVMNGSNSGDGGYIRMIYMGTVVIVKSGYPGGGINANWIITGGSLAVEVLVP